MHGHALQSPSPALVEDMPGEAGEEWNLYGAVNKAQANQGLTTNVKDRRWACGCPE